MEILKNRLLLLLLPALFLISCGKETDHQKASPWSIFAVNAENGEKTPKKGDKEEAEEEEKEEITGTKSELCVLPDYTPKQKAIEEEQIVEEPDREINDAATTFVTKYFFGTPESLYNFVKYVYQTLDDKLKEFREKHDLDEEAVFLVFKGGNVLRITANGIFDLLPEGAKNLLKEKYTEYFKRSDADFSVYIDEKKLKEGTYDEIFLAVDELVFDELNKIREEFKANPSTYFSFYEKDNDRSGQLEKTIEEMNKMSGVIEKGNPKYHNAQFYQLQLLEDSANPELQCPYEGKVDVRYAEKTAKDMPIPTYLTKEPDWLYNSDNRTIEFPLGSDPSKVIHFYLPRMKVALKAYFKKDGNYYSHNPVGELIDVSIPHKKSELEDFFAEYAKNIAEYTLHSADAKDKFKFKSYSQKMLAEDLQDILFEGATRPWLGGPKYKKRLYRLFFFHIIEMLTQFGIGSSNLADYLEELKTFVNHLNGFYPDKEESVALKVEESAERLLRKWPSMETTNDFWETLANFVKERLITKPEADDQEEFKKFLDIIEDNIGNAEELSRLTPPMKIDSTKVYDVPLRNLF